MDHNRKIYKQSYNRTVTCSNGKVWRYESYHYAIRYGEITNEDRASDKWEVLLEELNYIPEFKGNKTIRGRVYCNVDYHGSYHRLEDDRVYKDEFEKVEIHYNKIVIKGNEIKMSELIKGLNVDEFLLFLRDNEIAQLPMLR